MRMQCLSHALILISACHTQKRRQLSFQKRRSRCRLFAWGGGRPPSPPLGSPLCRSASGVRNADITVKNNARTRKKSSDSRPIKALRKSTHGIRTSILPNTFTHKNRHKSTHTNVYRVVYH